MSEVKNQTRLRGKKLALRIGLLCFAGLFLLYNLYLWNAKTMKGNVLPMPFGVGAAVVLSGSMEPELSIDDVILVVAQKDYKVNDVVVYQDGSIMVVHRIIRIEGTRVITQGDANNAEDAAIEMADIKGRVVTHWDGLGFTVRMLKKPTVSLSLLAAAIVLMELSFRKDKQESNDEVAKLEEQIRQLKEQQE